MSVCRVAENMAVFRCRCNNIHFTFSIHLHFLPRLETMCRYQTNDDCIVPAYRRKFDKNMIQRGQTAGLVRIKRFVSVLSKVKKENVLFFVRTECFLCLKRS